MRQRRLAADFIHAPRAHRGSRRRTNRAHAGLDTFLVEKERATFPDGIDRHADRQDRLPRLHDLGPRLRRPARARGDRLGGCYGDGRPRAPPAAPSTQAARPRTRPHPHRRARDRPRPRRARGLAAYARSAAVRPADRRLPGDPLQARRHGDAGRGSARAHVLQVAQRIDAGERRATRRRRWPSSSRPRWPSA